MSAVLETLALRYVDADRFNIAPTSKKFDCKFLEPGFVSYRDVGGKLELLKKETIERAMDSAVGIPVTIGHTMVTRENRAELENGIVTGWYFNSEDGWYHVTGTIETENALSLIRAGHRPSCGFSVQDLGPGGRDHGIRFDQEIADLLFNHLAIVERPRYAGADFRLNSITSAILPNMDNKIVKFLKRLVTRENAAADGTPGKEVITTQAHDISGNTEVEIDGMKVRLNELFDTYLQETASAFTATPEDSLEISGKAVTMGELATAWRAHKSRANALVTETPEQKLAREKKEADDKAAVETQRQNQIAADQKKKDDEEATRKNGEASFFKLHTAAVTPKTDGGYSTNSGSLKEKCKRAKGRY